MVLQNKLSEIDYKTKHIRLTSLNKYIICALNLMLESNLLD